jgi:hypothetical protein
MADKSYGEFQLRGLVLALGHRAAATAGALTAFVALFFHASVRAACLRGGATWLALMLITRATHWLLGRTYAERRAEVEKGSAELAESGSKR